MTLWEYVKSKMLEHPSQTVCENNASMTYEELCIYAEARAQRLNKKSYTILCHSEMASALALLSCIAAGKTAIPLPLRYGGQYCKKLLDFTKDSALITDIAGFSYEYAILSENIKESHQDEAVVILYTSGSTGTPKGIMLSEKNLICNIEDIRTYFPVTSNDTILISRPLYHSSVLTGEFLVSLCSGAKIIFTSESFQPLNIIKLLKENNVTVFGSTPTLITTLSRFVRNPKDLCVRLLSVSGECITEGMAKTIRKAFPDAAVYCGYGLSEASPRVAYLSAENFDEAPTCAGLPLPSVRIRIARADGKDAARGEIGEVLVKGDNVMIGYFNDAKRTKNTVRNGWLHTGDLGYINKGGMLYIKGRKDDMIIRAGMNIYPAEIENVLSADNRIRDIQVYGYEKNDTQEIGMTVSGDFTSSDEVMMMCRQQLPSYQVPSKIDLVDEIEKNVGGKRKRRITI